MQPQAAGGQPSTPPGWYPDPWRLAPQRWWDGLAWTGHTQGTQLAPPAYVPAPELPKARDDVRGGWTAILGFFGSLAVALVFARAALAIGYADLSLPVLVAGQLGLWSGFTMTAFMVTHRRAGGSFTDLGLFVPTGNEMRMGIAVGLAGLFVAARVGMALRALFPDDSTNSATHLLTGASPSATTIIITGLLACVGAPIFEELFFRGIVQPILTRHLGAAPAIVAQALLFGTAHFQLGMTMNQAVVRCGTVAVIGLFLGYLRNTTGRLGAGMVAHATNNLVVVLLTFAALSH